jgi:cell division septation protein DedD
MIKPLIILFNTVSVFLFSFFFGDTPVAITGNFPKNAKPGTEFPVEIKINKGNIGGFAKFQIEVPQGFTVKESESKGGNFSFAANIGKIIWTATPTDPEFTVKFILITDASVSGSKTIGAKFSYVNNNNKEVVEMAPAEIMIGEGSAVAASETPAQTTPPAASTDNSSSTTTPATSSSGNSGQGQSLDNPVEPNSNVICSRTISSGATANEVNVEVRIKKPGIKGFAKYQEVLPAGYNAKGVKTNGSSFSVSDGKAKFVWVSLPPEDEMIISYVLEKSESASADGRLENGEFSYLESDQTKKIKMPVEPVKAGAASSEPVVNNNATTTQTQEAVPQTTTAVTTTEPVANNTNTTPEPVKNTTTEPVATNTVAKKEGNVQYAVQVGAFRNAIQSEVLSKKFNISETIKSEMAEGFSKFMVGNFGEYKEARNHREDMKQKGCNSAFVVAYNGAKRITVQEALMITSQKWYK